MAVIEEARLSDDKGLIRHYFDSRQGVSYARAPIIAFLDDDGVPSPDWVYAMKRAFEEYPQADCIGGRVKPVWNNPRPSWLNAAHAGLVALQDRAQPQWTNRANASACLLTANLGVRRSVFDDVGLFSPEFPRNQERELELRMWRIHGVAKSQPRVILAGRGLPAAVIPLRQSLFGNFDEHVRRRFTCIAARLSRRFAEQTCAVISADRNRDDAKCIRMDCRRSHGK